jgi:hypothetical protein
MMMQNIYLREIRRGHVVKVVQLPNGAYLSGSHEVAGDFLVKVWLGCEELLARVLGILFVSIVACSICFFLP